MSLERAGIAALVAVLACGPSAARDESCHDGDCATSAAPSTSSDPDAGVTSVAPTSGSGGASGADASDSDAPASTRGADTTGAADTGGDAGSTGGVPDHGIEVDLCPAVTAESAYCLLVGNTFVVAGVDSSTPCDLGVPFIAQVGTPAAWIGNDVVTCPLSMPPNIPNFVRVDLETAEYEGSDVPCSGIGALGTQLVVSHSDAPGELRVYDSFDDLNQGIVADTLAYPPTTRNISASGSTIYTLSGSGIMQVTALHRYSLASGGAIADLPLAGFEDFVSGFSVVDDRIFVIPSTLDHKLLEFDATTGAQVAQIDEPTWVSGIMACRPGV